MATVAEIIAEMTRPTVSELLKGESLVPADALDHIQKRNKPLPLSSLGKSSARLPPPVQSLSRARSSDTHVQPVSPSLPSAKKDVLEIVEEMNADVTALRGGPLVSGELPPRRGTKRPFPPPPRAEQSSKTMRTKAGRASTQKVSANSQNATKSSTRSNEIGNESLRTAAQQKGTQGYSARVLDVKDRKRNSKSPNEAPSDRRPGSPLETLFKPEKPEQSSLSPIKALFKQRKENLKPSSERDKISPASDAKKTAPKLFLRSAPVNIDKDRSNGKNSDKKVSRKDIESSKRERAERKPSEPAAMSEKSLREDRDEGSSKKSSEQKNRMRSYPLREKSPETEKLDLNGKAHGDKRAVGRADREDVRKQNVKQKAGEGKSREDKNTEELTPKKQSAVSGRLEKRSANVDGKNPKHDSANTDLRNKKPVNALSSGQERASESCSARLPLRSKSEKKIAAAQQDKSSGASGTKDEKLKRSGLSKSQSERENVKDNESSLAKSKAKDSRESESSSGKKESLKKRKSIGGLDTVTIPKKPLKIVKREKSEDVSRASSRKAEGESRPNHSDGLRARSDASNLDGASRSKNPDRSSREHRMDKVANGSDRSRKGENAVKSEAKSRVVKTSEHSQRKEAVTAKEQSHDHRRNESSDKRREEKESSIRRRRGSSKNKNDTDSATDPRTMAIPRKSNVESREISEKTEHRRHSRERADRKELEMTPEEDRVRSKHTRSERKEGPITSERDKDREGNRDRASRCTEVQERESGKARESREARRGERKGSARNSRRDDSFDRSQDDQRRSIRESKDGTRNRDSSPRRNSPLESRSGSGRDRDRRNDRDRERVEESERSRDRTREFDRSRDQEGVKRETSRRDSRRGVRDGDDERRGVNKHEPEVEKVHTSIPPGSSSRPNASTSNSPNDIEKKVSAKMGPIPNGFRSAPEPSSIPHSENGPLKLRSSPAPKPIRSSPAQKPFRSSPAPNTSSAGPVKRRIANGLETRDIFFNFRSLHDKCQAHFVNKEYDLYIDTARKAFRTGFEYALAKEDDMRKSSGEFRGASGEKRDKLRDEIAHFYLYLAKRIGGKIMDQLKEIERKDCIPYFKTGMHKAYLRIFALRQNHNLEERCMDASAALASMIERTRQQEQNRGDKESSENQLSASRLSQIRHIVDEYTNAIRLFRGAVMDIGAGPDEPGSECHIQ